MGLTTPGETIRCRRGPVCGMGLCWSSAKRVQTSCKVLAKHPQCCRLGLVRVDLGVVEWSGGPTAHASTAGARGHDRAVCLLVPTNVHQVVMKGLDTGR